MVERLGAGLAVVVAVLVVASVVSMPCMAQTPTPPATPTPSVLTTESGTFVLEPRITYGEAGILIGLVILTGVLLLRVALEVVTWLLR